ncbi:hypothetical protein SUGI_0962130 [Cryptomeria japonica]|nr:hypothetical protein SUGI_0962130 [Cryptomeria japonica]
MEGLNLNLKLKALAFFMLVSSICVVYAQPGFISLACGGGEGAYNDSNGIQWTSDKLYIESGETHTLSNAALDYQLQHVRSFPQGKRNCYVLPANRGTKYLIRASFLYANYDGLQAQPKFELLIDANLWTTVMINNTWDIDVEEAIMMAKTTSISICLGRSGTDTPFISSLELRPIKPSMYALVGLSFSMFGVTRGDFGAPLNSSIRYPDDDYDRIWSGQGTGTGLSYMTTSNKIDTSNINLPSSVMSTAWVPTNVSSKGVYVSWDFDQIGLYYFAVSFAELEVLKPNDTREFNISIGGTLWYGNEKPSFLVGNTVYSSPTYMILSTGQTKFSLVATTRSTLPPLINAWEIYRFSSVLVNGTDSNDVVAANDILRHFNFEKDWTGDPCVPQKYSWDWVNCSTDSSPRIIAMQLSGKGLNGTIPASFGNLSALVKLNLSNNNLSGSIPEELTQLSNLNELDLTNNNLTGSVPDGLADKQRNGKLDLSINGNNLDCVSNACSNSTTKNHSKKKVAVWVIIAGVAAVAILAALVLLIIWIKSNNRTPLSTTSKTEASSMKGDIVNPEACRSYSYQEVKEMTSDFHKQIGKGGYGPVYLGWLQDREVAVKVLSDKSHQGPKEFSTEVDMLSRVHHKNLVKLIGYCIEEENMVLIYEFMSNGDLRKRLDGQNCRGKCLDWQTRLNIALDAAQGLEYLHNGCNPGIIHRDVKSSNILLNGSMEAKVADFGLSKYGPLNGATHISTLVKGTPGYLDPEYYTLDRLTEKSDVFSFGVVLLEIISGHQPVISESSTEKQAHISSWARKFMLKGDIESIADPAMEKKYETEDLWKLAELAMACCSEESVQRPTMSEVVLQLKESTRSPTPPHPLHLSSPEISHLSLLNPRPR